MANYFIYSSSYPPFNTFRDESFLQMISTVARENYFKSLKIPHLKMCLNTEQNALKKALLVGNKIDVLKIDVEGKEREILKNIKKKYFNKIRVINIEGNNFDNIVPSYFAHSFKGSASRFINMKV